MKKLFKRYNRACRAAFMLLVVYSIHLFSFYALVANSSSFFYGHEITHAQKKKPAPIKHTETLLHLVKHEVLKKIGIEEGWALLPQEVSVDLVNYQSVARTVADNPHRLSAGIYKLYRLLRTFLI
jgi:hypothetical protein